MLNPFFVDDSEDEDDDEDDNDDNGFTANEVTFLYLTPLKNNFKRLIVIFLRVLFQ